MIKERVGTIEERPSNPTRTNKTANLNRRQCNCRRFCFNYINKTKKLTYFVEFHQNNMYNCTITILKLISKPRQQESTKMNTINKINMAAHVAVKRRTFSWE